MSSFLLLLLVLVPLLASSQELKHTLVRKEVAIQANLEKIKLEINLVNAANQPAKQYKLVLTKDEQARLSYALALFNPNDETTYTELHQSKNKKTQPGHVEYLLDLPQPIQPQGTLQFHIRLALLHPTEPLPAKVVQNEEIFQRYKANGKFYSPYDSDEQISEFNVGSSVIKSYSEPAGVKVSVTGESITYVWGAVPKSTVEPISFHFRAEKSFITFRKVVREIEVSQWGNVAIEEHYEVENTAAGFHKGFSRLDYQMNPHQKDGPNNFESFTAILPASATGVYFRDYLGNVTTSNFRSGRKSSVLELRSRFPLMPSWKADFYFGYNLPSQDLLFVDQTSGRLVLDTRFGTPLKTGVIDELIVRVILPEGASDYKYEVPFEVNHDFSHRYTYLDTTGRPLLEFTKKNVVPFHNKMFQVSYSFPSLYIFREPLYLVFGFFTFFMASLVYTRIIAGTLSTTKKVSVTAAPAQTAAPSTKGRKKSTN